MFVKNLFFVVCICLIVTAFAAKKNNKNKKSSTTTPATHVVRAEIFTADNDTVECETDDRFENPFANLTDTQKTEFKSLIEEIHAPNSTLTKDQVKAKLDAFKATLPTSIQNLLNRPTPSALPTPSTANLSSEAQALVAQIEAVKNDGSITFAQEHEKIKNLIGNATDSVKAEIFKNGPGSQGQGGFGGKGQGRFGGQGQGGFGSQAHGSFGGQGQGGFGGQGQGRFGGQRRGGFGGQEQGGFGGMGLFGNVNGTAFPGNFTRSNGSHFTDFQSEFGGVNGHHEKSIIPSFILLNLTDAQKTQLKTLEEQIRAPNSTLTKDQIKSQIDTFKTTLSSEVQAALNNLPTPSARPTPSTANLSSEAQALVAQIEAVKNDGSITPAQEHEKIKNLIGNATESVRNELEKIHGGHEGGFGGHQGGFGKAQRGFGTSKGGFGGDNFGFGGPQNLFEQHGFGNFEEFRGKGFEERNRARRCRPKATASTTA